MLLGMRCEVKNEYRKLKMVRQTASMNPGSKTERIELGLDRDFAKLLKIAELM